jgi:hypothetical protein
MGGLAVGPVAPGLEPASPVPPALPDGSKVVLAAPSSPTPQHPRAVENIRHGHKYVVTPVHRRVIVGAGRGGAGGSPYSTPIAFWCTVSTIHAAGHAVMPYHLDAPTFGDSGSPWHAGPTSHPLPPRRPTRLRCASPTSGCSTPPPCAPTTSGPARSTPRPRKHPRILHHMRHGCSSPAALLIESAQPLAGQLDIGPHALHVAAVPQRLDEPEKLAGAIAVNGHADPALQAGLRGPVSKIPDDHPRPR